MNATHPEVTPRSHFPFELDPEYLCSTALTDVELPFHYANAYVLVQLPPVFGRKNGYPAITDTNLVLGRILPEFFPSIFGEDEKQPLDAEASKKALQKIAHEVNEQAKAAGQPEKSVEEVRWSLLSTCLSVSVFAPVCPCVCACICPVCMRTHMSALCYWCNSSCVEEVYGFLWLRFKASGVYMGAAYASHMQPDRNLLQAPHLLFITPWSLMPYTVTSCLLINF